MSTGIFNVNGQLLTTGVFLVTTGVFLVTTGIIMFTTGIMKTTGNWQRATRNWQLTTGNGRFSKSRLLRGESKFEKITLSVQRFAYSFFDFQTFQILDAKTWGWGVDS